MMNRREIQNHATAGGRIARTALLLLLIGAAVGALSLRQQPAQAAGLLGGGAASEEVGRYTFSNLADKVLPSVVTVYVKRSMQREMQNQNDQIDQLRRLFGNDPRFQQVIPNLPSAPSAPGAPDPYGFADQYVPISSGSGIIISSDGYILTNDHVITSQIDPRTTTDKELEDRLTIVLSDGTEIEGAKLIFKHSLVDLALLKVEQKGLTPIKWANSDKLRVGERVAAIGSPLDLRATITQGIVCAKERDVESMMHLIQTDAVINPGSSGGALVNLDGELVGINRLITSNSGRWQGFGFAIPSNDAKWFADEVVKSGKVEFGYIGVGMENDGPDKMRMLSTLGIEPSMGGVYINFIPDQSPSRAAGIEVGDFITDVDGRRVQGNNDLLDYIKRQPAGKTVDVTVLRPDADLKPQKKSFKVKLGTRPSEEALRRDDNFGGLRAPQAPAPSRDADAPLFGMDVEPAETPTGAKGLRILSVAPGSPAARAGLQAGDIVLQLNRRDTTSAETLRSAEQARPADRGANVLKFHREGREQLTTIEPPAK